jgi:uridine kinase
MTDPLLLDDNARFSETLYQKMDLIDPGISELELYEFRYALDLITPNNGWKTIPLMETESIETLIQQPDFYENVKIKPMKNNRIILDEKVAWLTRLLFVGLVTEKYSPQWVKKFFYFDIRGFIFLVRTKYYTEAILEHFEGHPFVQFAPGQKALEKYQDIGYKEYKEANRVIDQAFIDALKKVIATKGTPLLLTLVGPSAAGKTEIVSRLSEELTREGKSITSIEMDNFFKDRDFRDGKPMDKEVIHFDLFQQCMKTLLQGKTASMPKYYSAQSISTHDLNSNLRPGQTPLQVEPADIILLEGNFPFYIPEIAPLIGIKIVYLTDDPIRLKRKWRRDIDYRRKYDPVYLCNRYFRTQFLRAREVYLPMMEISDMVVDTTAASLWLTPEMASALKYTE